jgi:uncharacterized membrane protein YecN with MAPEG domain
LEDFMRITALYAGLLAFLFIYLSASSIRTRRSVKVGVGDGGDQTLLRAIRVHANFAEYVPFALVLMALAESTGTWAWLLHVLGLSLLAGRLSHAYGVSKHPEPFKFRVRGMFATISVIGIAAAASVYGAIKF